MLADLVSESESALEERKKDMKRCAHLKKKTNKRESGVEIALVPAPNPSTHCIG